MTAAIDLSARLAEILADPSFEPELLARRLWPTLTTPRAPWPNPMNGWQGGNSAGLTWELRRPNGRR